MKTIQFSCTLLTDVIMSDTSATSGNRHSLDFIPGNNFLGIAASTIYKKEAESDKTQLLFHSGKVRFGDAHPSINGVRGVHIPAVFFVPKLKKAGNGHYLHHLLPDELPDDIRKKQLKQCREGFYCFDDRQATKVKVDKGFALKSAYDSEKRRSKDQQLFGYEAMSKGVTLYFDVEMDDDVAQYAEEIADALLGKRHMGRSRTAQYGLVEIAEANFEQLKSRPEAEQGEVLVYADGRLIFFDENGLPTLQPTAQQLGFGEKAEVCWQKSQVRTFSYAPWNFKRQAFDSQRCGIEKGSVLVVKAKSVPKSAAYVGCYQQEGFGRVVYNPEILFKVRPECSCLSAFDFEKEQQKADDKASEKATDTNLLAFLRRAKEKEKGVVGIQKAVNEYVNKHRSDFKGEKFASQWGSIRSIAMVTTGRDELIKRVLKFLDHGVARQQWEDRGRKESLKGAMSLPVSNLQEFLVNLASEMAKECKSN